MMPDSVTCRVPSVAVDRLTFCFCLVRLAGLYLASPQSGQLFLLLTQQYFLLSLQRVVIQGRVREQLAEVLSRS